MSFLCEVTFKLLTDLLTFHQQQISTDTAVGNGYPLESVAVHTC
jgi:hypothetical protein